MMDAWSADFETTTDENDCRVWAWGICNVYNIDEFYHGTEISTFFEILKNKGCNNVWFHNLEFDGKFIIDYLLNNGFTHVDDKPDYNEFSTLISKLGKFYSITVNLGSVTTRFCDSLKLYPMSVATIAKSFGFDEQKGEIDYTAHRRRGHILTQQEYDYLRRDLQIVAKALAQNIDEGLTRITVGSNAFADFKKSHKRTFSSICPVIDLEQDAFIRDAYKGGFTFCNPKYEGKDVYNGISVDYNSMYPSQMISNPFPFGQPQPFDGQYTHDDEYPLYVQALTADIRLKQNGLPFIQVKGGMFDAHKHIDNSNGYIKLTLSSVDLDMLFDNYDVDVLSWDGGYKFKSVTGIFDDYVSKWSAVKKTSTGGKRVLAKLFLNSLYGKFGTNPDVTPKIPELCEDGIVRYRISENLEDRDPVYIPIAVFVTAYSRKALIDGIKTNYDRFIYCDTDSMHLLGTEPPAGIKLHDNDFCAWKVEGTFTHARHLRAKCYIWDLNGEISVTCAGMPQNIKNDCTFDNFYIGYKNYDIVDGQKVIRDGLGKLLPKAVKGGIILRESEYELRA